MSAYGITRCGEIEVDGVPRTAAGPNGETCARQNGHPYPCSAATPKWEGTVFWDGLNTKRFLSGRLAPDGDLAADGIGTKDGES